MPQPRRPLAAAVAALAVLLAAPAARAEDGCPAGMRALAPGRTLFRVSAGAGLGKSGPLRPQADAVALEVAP